MNIIRWLWVIVLAGTLAVCVPKPRLDGRYTIPYTSPELLWQFVCQVNADPCRDLDAPDVVPSRMYAQMGYLGGFSVETPKQVALDVAAIDTLYGNRVFVDSVIVHEMQHYYDFWRGKITLPYSAPENRCAVEGKGFDTQAVFLLANGAPELVDHDWRIRYGC